jgi:hypothetical protein
LKIQEQVGKILTVDKKMQKKTEKKCCEPKTFSIFVVDSVKSDFRQRNAGRARERYNKSIKMALILQYDDTRLCEAFETIANSDQASDYIREIALLVVKDGLTREAVQGVLAGYGLRIGNIRNELLDVLIAYANYVLEDNLITEKEQRNFGFLKLIFGIREGDFYKHKLPEIKAIIAKQAEKIYSDNTVSETEALHGVNLQEMFDLSYAQFDQIKADEVEKALDRGANFLDLDTANVKLLKSK